MNYIEYETRLRLKALEKALELFLVNKKSGTLFIDESNASTADIIQK